MLHTWVFLIYFVCKYFWLCHVKEKQVKQLDWSDKLDKNLGDRKIRKENESELILLRQKQFTNIEFKQLLIQKKWFNFN